MPGDFALGSGGRPHLHRERGSLHQQTEVELQEFELGATLPFTVEELTQAHVLLGEPEDEARERRRRRVGQSANVSPTIRTS
jgi:hypothetical protein